MSQAALDTAFDRLLEIHKRIRGQFANLGDDELEGFLTKSNTPRLRQQVRTHGDGYTLRSIPRTLADLRTVKAFILVVMNSPKLTDQSIFDPFIHLPDISYWQRTKDLNAHLDWGHGPCRVQFMVWEQECPVHGTNDCEAKRNRQTLIRHAPELPALFRQEAEKAILFLTASIQYLQKFELPLVILTNTQRSYFCEPIISLLGDRHVAHIQSKLFGLNRTIMSRIAKTLIGGHNAMFQ